MADTDLMDDRTETTLKTEGVLIGELVGLSDMGEPLVVHPQADPTAALRAVTTVPLSLEHIGGRAVLAFEAGDPNRPVILGMVVEQGAATVAGKPVAIQLDDGSLTLSGDREIKLQCGKASITLTRAGKVLVKGAYLSSRSSGVHRIKGASVHVN